MKEITSTTNDLVKETVKLQQKKYRENYLLIEGIKSVEEAIEAGLTVKYIFTKEKEKYKEFETYLTNDAVMKKISTTESPSSVVAVVKKPVYKIEQFKNFKKIILLDNIKDAGNLGTIIRAASAFGVEGILLFGDTVDEFSPKTIRSSAGNMFKIPILKLNFDDLKKFKNTHKFLATVCHSNNFLDEISIKQPVIILFGSEASGLCEELLSITDNEATIKIKNDVESLNLALSVGIVLYELQKM